MRFRFVDTKEVNHLICLSKNNKPSGVHNLRTDVVNDALKILLIEFTSLINECLDRPYVPKSWKHGIITPIPKISNCQTPIDYRPISVLPTASKVLERVVHNQLVYFLDSNGILDHCQHGFRKDHSTLSAIYDVTQHLYHNMDPCNITYCVFINYAKSFDTLDHTILLRKLTEIGLSAQVVEWCSCYLIGRKQSVKNGENISEELGVSYGVPQGSILGPLFFIIYVNDLLHLFNENDPKITMYADDTVVYISDKNSDLACYALEHGLAKLSKWCAQNKLSINVKKTKLLIVDPLKLGKIYPCPKLNGKLLERVNGYNYLGVSIDENLLFDEFSKKSMVNCMPGCTSWAKYLSSSVQAQQMSYVSK